MLAYYLDMKDNIQMPARKNVKSRAKVDFLHPISLSIQKKIETVARATRSRVPHVGRREQIDDIGGTPLL